MTGPCGRSCPHITPDSQVCFEWRKRCLIPSEDAGFTGISSECMSVCSPLKQSLPAMTPAPGRRREGKTCTASDTRCWEGEGCAAQPLCTHLASCHAAPRPAAQPTSGPSPAQRGLLPSGLGLRARGAVDTTVCWAPGTPSFKLGTLRQGPAGTWWRVGSSRAGPRLRQARV